ncbi:MAG: hypothetical protein H7840_04815 [Alphaproteobacteria bacterium]
MADNKDDKGHVPVRGDEALARNKVQVQRNEVRHILNRIKASKAKRMASRPQPHIEKK